MSRWAHFKAWLFGTAATADVEADEPLAHRGAFSTDAVPIGRKITGAQIVEAINKNVAKNAPKLTADATAAMDGMDLTEVGVMQLQGADLSETLLSWFGLQTFIGYQLCAILAQHWLIDRICTLPARDAVRHGFEILLPGVPETEQPVMKDKIADADKTFHLNRHLIDFARFGRIFGVRVALFKFEMEATAEEEYYAAPFNPDGIKPGTYRGIVQIDPYWVTPVLDTPSVLDPASVDFYEPTWWMIRGRKYHKSHLAIFRTAQPADFLKPTYQYGGVPLPQRIMERVYAAERTANEAPQLAMTKRFMTWATDMGHIFANQEQFALHMDNMTAMRDNYGFKVHDREDTMNQFDTTLTGLSDIIEGQYDIVCAAGGVPITKVMMKSPKGGLGQSGNYEEATYHEELETVQDLDLTPLVDRHHLCVARSELQIKTPIRHQWNPVNSPSAKEQAETNKINSETDKNNVDMGALDAEDVRNRLRTQKDTGYTGIDPEVPEPPEEEEPDNAETAAT